MAVRMIDELRSVAGKLAPLHEGAIRFWQLNVTAGTVRDVRDDSLIAYVDPEWLSLDARGDLGDLHGK